MYMADPTHISISFPDCVVVHTCKQTEPYKAPHCTYLVAHCICHVGMAEVIVCHFCQVLYRAEGSHVGCYEQFG